MKVLWIINSPLPESINLIKKSSEKVVGTLTQALSDSISEVNSVDLAIAAPMDNINRVVKFFGKSIKYYLLPDVGKCIENNKFEVFWKEIHDDFIPDIVHIHGTEYSHGLSYMRLYGGDNVVVSIQGLISVIARYYLGGLSKWDIIKNLTFHDIIKGSLITQQTNYFRRGKYECEMLKLAAHVVGRTSWDRAHTFAIKPNVNYHYCNELMRDTFYFGKWKYEKCLKHSIFISQGYYPLKGLHIALKALPLILNKYPDATIRVAGTNIFYWPLYRKWGYAKIVESLIANNNIKDKVTFCGQLSAEQMKSEMLNCNVYLSPSSIENSPNSLCEAQLLGTPHVASYVGGTMDFMIGNEDNLYRYDDYEMLAQKVCSIFEAKEKQIDLSEIARQRHKKEDYINTTLSIYKDIYNK